MADGAAVASGAAVADEAAVASGAAVANGAAVASGAAWASGLDEVVVADTELSEVDGERGRLVVRGHDIEALAGRVPFEAVCALLWTGALDGAADLAARLGEARARAFERLAPMADALRARDGMDALRAALARLELDADASPEGARVEVTATVAVAAGAWAALGRGEAPRPPERARGHAEDLLAALTGAAAPPAAAARALDAYLVTVADHGLNASTFAARVVASTGSDPVSAVVAAVGALKGPLHGGAPGPVLDMLDAIGSAERAPAWLAAELAAGRRLMGFGHRIYRVRDPRAAVLERALAGLEGAGLASARLALARAVEAAALAALARGKPGRALAANVEYATALLLDALGIDRAAFSVTFACGRVAGWLAHIAEQRAAGRLVRPRSRYVGAAPASR